MGEPSNNKEESRKNNNSHNNNKRNNNKASNGTLIHVHTYIPETTARTRAATTITITITTLSRGNKKCQVSYKIRAIIFNKCAHTHTHTYTDIQIPATAYNMFLFGG